MNCQNCGYPLVEGEQFCSQCGAYTGNGYAQPSVPDADATTVLTPDQAPGYAQQPIAYAEQPVAYAQQPVAYAQQPQYAAPVAQEVPSQYRPLGPWAYFGLQILYTIPLVGFIFLIIFSFKSDNLNRRNFTRSYWCGLLIAAILGVIILVILLVTGVALTDVLSQSGSGIPMY